MKILSLLQPFAIAAALAASTAHAGILKDIDGQTNFTEGQRESDEDGFMINLGRVNLTNFFVEFAGAGTVAVDTGSDPAAGGAAPTFSLSGAYDIYLIYMDPVDTGIVANAASYDLTFAAPTGTTIAGITYHQQNFGAIEAFFSGPGYNYTFDSASGRDFEKNRDGLDRFSFSSSSIHFENLVGDEAGNGENQWLDNAYVFVAVPEPSSLLFSATLGAMGLLFLRRRRN